MFLPLSVDRFYLFTPSQGFLFRAQPTLMTKPRSASIMDDIFSSPEDDGKGRLLKIMQEFLVSESEKHSARLKGELSNSCV